MNWITRCLSCLVLTVFLSIVGCSSEEEPASSEEVDKAIIESTTPGEEVNPSP